MAALIPSFFTDFLQSFRFWLFDVAPIDSLGLPLFFPLYGFSRITSPEVSLTTKTIREANWPFDRKVLMGANVSPVTLERGVFWLDSDFWKWVQASVFGDISLSAGFAGPTIRRNIMLVHFFSRGPVGAGDLEGFDTAKAINNTLGAAGLLATAGIGFSLTNQSALSDAGVVVGGASIGGFTAATVLSPGSAVRIPAKAWLLYGCIPTRYKTASDFDASSSAVSLAELDLEYERFEEISLAQ